MGADRRLNGHGRMKAVPLASLPAPQRRLISALLEAAQATDAKKAGDGSR